MQSPKGMFRNLLGSPAFWLGGFAIVAAVAANATVGDTGGQAVNSSGESNRSEVVKSIREGARMELREARVRIVGETLVFTVEGHAPIEGLENLALQRVYQAILDDPTHDRWLVTGQITEFRDRNYLLLDRGLRAPDKINKDKSGKK